MDLFPEPADPKEPRIVFEYENAEGAMVTLYLPARFDVCDRCEGKGSHVNPSVDDGGFQAEDPEDLEAYMSGAYDVTCYSCKGARVVPVLNEEETKRRAEWVLDAYTERMESNAAYERERAMERKMGA
jgi:hypothetical protein